MPAQTSAPLMKKTKAEIINEYGKLLEKYDELKTSEKEIFNKENRNDLELVKKDFTKEAISQSVSRLKLSVHENLNELSRQINNSLNALLSQLADKIENFSKIQEALEFSKKELELSHKIKFVAGLLDQLISSYEKKKKQLEKEYLARTEEIGSEIENKRKEWKREQEEYEYDLKTKRAREGVIFEEKRRKKEEELKQREGAVKNREEEYLRVSREGKEQLELREQEFSVDVEARYKNDFNLAKKDWDTEKQILELKEKGLIEINKKLEAEMLRLKKELEAANFKSQELAIKIVESGAGIELEQEKTKISSKRDLDNQQ